MTMEADDLVSSGTTNPPAATASDDLPGKPPGKPPKKPPGEIDQSEYEREEIENGVLNLGDTTNYSIPQRNLLFQKGLNFERDGSPDHALKCYLACMKGLKNKTRFALLPECLRNIADIYQAKGEFENAIQFAQAEKLFYENALIETKEIQRVLEEVRGEKSGKEPLEPKDINDLNIQAIRADEYEHLARLCVDNGEAHLALEYAGKCAQIRQEVYGTDHQKTKTTLDFFASLYANAGKEQYIDSCHIMSDFGETEDISDGVQNVPEVVMSNFEAGEPVSILRQRSVTQSKQSGEAETDKEKKQVRFHSSVEDSIKQKRKEELLSLTITLVLLAVCFLILASLGLWLYCSIDKTQPCSAMTARIKSWATSVQYKLHQLTASSPPSSKSGYADL